MTIVVLPSELVEVISVTPEIPASRRSSGAATVAAIRPGSAPGRLAVTRMVGNSIDGRLATGRKRYATMPTRKSPIAKRVVPIGRRMNGYEMFIIATRPLAAEARASARRLGGVGSGDPSVA